MTKPKIELFQQADFDEIAALISAARQRAVQAVNTTLIDLYWQVGQAISHKIEQAQWGDGVVAQLAEHLARTQPGLRGFTSRNLFRMRQFYEAYRNDEIVSPLVRLLPWTHNLIIMNQSQRPEEREFYLRQAVREQWSERELERQLKSALFERTVLSPVKVSPLVSQIHPDALSVFKDTPRRATPHRRQSRRTHGHVRSARSPAHGHPNRQLPFAGGSFAEGTFASGSLRQLSQQGSRKNEIRSSRAILFSN